MPHPSDELVEILTAHFRTRTPDPQAAIRNVEILLLAAARCVTEHLCAHARSDFHQLRELIAASVEVYDDALQLALNQREIPPTAARH